MKRRAAAITDEQVRALFEQGAIDEATYRGAILVPAHHGSLGKRVRRECRRTCTVALAVRTKEDRC